MQLTKAPSNRLISEDSEELTLDSVKAAMPKRQKHNITQGLVDELNKIVNEPEEREAFRNNLLSYTSVLQDPNVKLETYIHAVKYASFKLMGMTNQEAWMKTFPERYQRLIDAGKDDGHIRATVSCYRRNKIVAQVMEQAMIPTYVLNQDLFQKALNTQAHLMVTAKSEKVRSDAANSLLTHLKQPETTKLKLDVNVKQDDSIKELKEATLELVKAQRLSIEAGANSAEDIARGKLIDGESTRID